MSDSSSTELTLDHVAKFHKQLILMDRAGLPVRLDDSAGWTSSLPVRLNEIMAGLASELGHGKSLEQVIQDAPFVSDRYRLALSTYRGQTRVSSLALLRAPAQHDVEGSADIRLALLLPLVMLVLIYLASFYLLLVTLPRMEAVYAQLNAPPSWPVVWLMRVRSAMSIWVPALPVAVVLMWWLLASGRLRLPRWMPGRARSFKYLEASLLANHMADRLALSPVALSTTADSSRWLKTPLVNWAINEVPDGLAEPAREREGRLRVVASLYESMQAIYAQRFRAYFFTLACIVLGGGLVLMYCLALFVPLIQLLSDILG